MRTAFPAIVTIGNAVCGLTGIIVLSVGGAHAVALAAIFIFAAWLFDVCDGPLARRLQAESPFGVILDSVCDVVSFGVLPALLVVVAGRDAHPTVAIAIAVTYLAAALLRLARYTAHALDAAPATIRWWFAGLPSPVAAMTIGAVILADPSRWAMLFAVAAANAVLMVSTLPYSDLVKVYARRRLPAWTLVLPLGACPVFGWHVVLLVAFVAYIASGGVIALFRHNVETVAP